MYNIPYFKETDREGMLRFMRQHPFALLTGCADNRPVATQVPLLVTEREGRLYLQGHFMRQTDHHKAFGANPQALCVFTGAHTYVSASWYNQPQTASTWNYMTLHARGRLQFLDEAGLLQVLSQTTALFENNPRSPAAFEKLPADYINRLKGAIVAFEVAVEELDHIVKLSQNRDRESYENIIRHLSAGTPDARVIAREMQDRLPKLFEQTK